MRKRAVLFSLFFILSQTRPILSAEAAASPVLPSSGFLVDIIAGKPTQAYKGRMMVSRWSGRDSEAEEVNIYFFPPDRYRLEFLKPDGTLDRVILSTDNQEELQLFEKGELANSYNNPSSSRRVGRKKTKELILKNYTLNVKETETAMGRPAWIIELTPLMAGKPVQQIWIDKKTQVILEAKRFFPNGTTGSLIRFTTFEVEVPIEESLFLPAKDAPHDLIDNDERPMPQHASLVAGGELQGGFFLESVDNFEVQGKEVKHLRFTDGLIPLSVFETPVPVNVPREGAETANIQRPLDLNSFQAEQVYAWERDKTYYTLIGDMQQNLFKQIATSLK